MNWPDDPLTFDPEGACEAITALIQEQVVAQQRDGVVLGLSGGLDSAVAAYLTVRSVGSERVTARYMPERDSKRRHGEDAKLIADLLGIHLDVQDLTAALEALGTYNLLPLRFLPGRSLKDWAVRLGKGLGFVGEGETYLAQRLQPRSGSLVARGNAYASAKHRLRMVQLYTYADVHNLLVVGAANRTEWLTGTFSQWGCDQCADVMPLLHLYRSQLPPLAAYLGVPERVRTKPADPDVIPGIDDKEALLGSFATVDQILWGLEHGLAQEVLDARFGAATTARIQALVASARHMWEAPYALDVA